MVFEHEIHEHVGECRWGVADVNTKVTLNSVPCQNILFGRRSWQDDLKWIALNKLQSAAEGGLSCR